MPLIILGYSLVGVGTVAIITKTLIATGILVR